MIPVRVTLLTAAGCHYCAFAKEIVARLGQEWPIDLEEISLFSERGAELALHDGPRDWRRPAFGFERRAAMVAEARGRQVFLAARRTAARQSRAATAAKLTRALAPAMHP